uniref:Uncharacterized protein n=1 Tax=Rhizophora mucronata TaxID=61149 RepID=A0A2P2J096_RHIMU
MSNTLSSCGLMNLGSSAVNKMVDRRSSLALKKLLRTMKVVNCILLI